MSLTGHELVSVTLDGDAWSWECECGASVVGQFASEHLARQYFRTHAMLSIITGPIVESVSHPAHYQTKNGLEAIDVIEAFELNFRIGNAVKYLLRAGKKGSVKVDLEKAIWYIRREIEKGESA